MRLGRAWGKISVCSGSGRPHIRLQPDRPESMSCTCTRALLVGCGARLLSWWRSCTSASTWRTATSSQVGARARSFPAPAFPPPSRGVPRSPTTHRALRSPPLLPSPPNDGNRQRAAVLGPPQAGGLQREHALQRRAAAHGPGQVRHATPTVSAPLPTPSTCLLPHASVVPRAVVDPLLPLLLPCPALLKPTC